MRVLHITTTDKGGAGLCCLRIHQSLLDRGIESRVVTIHNTKHAPEEFELGYLKSLMVRTIAKGLRMLGLKIFDQNKILALSKRYHAAYSLPVSSINLTKCQLVEWADIIHLHWVNNYLDYPSFFSKVKKPIVWTLHDENFFYGIAHYSETLLQNHPLEQKYARIKREAYYNINRMGVVLLSEYFLNKFSGHQLLRGREVRVINNPIDTEVYKPMDKTESRRKLGFSEDEILIGFTSYNIFDKRKGLKVLSDAISEMEKARKKRMTVLAIGGNPQNDILDNVVSLGLITDAIKMREVLSACDFFAMPSYQEAFAQSPMEAMACGLPVVAFPVSGTSELINDKNGVVCADFTCEALHRGIEILMGREYSGSDIRKDMIDRFSPRVIAQKYVKLYEELAKE